MDDTLIMMGSVQGVLDLTLTYNWEWNTLALSSAQTVGGTSYPAGTVFDGGGTGARR